MLLIRMLLMIMLLSNHVVNIRDDRVDDNGVDEATGNNVHC